jgi:hypothetical protein
MRCSLAASLLCLLSSTAAWAEEPSKPEWICSSDAPTEGFPRAFSVKLEGKQFCFERACWSLTVVAADTLEYQCPPRERGEYCASGGDVISSAGPFFDDERLTIELKAKTFRGLASGQIGDLGRRPYVAQISGSCISTPSQTTSKR